MIVVTGATGHLGRHVINQLLERVPAKEIAVAVRNVEKASELGARGIDVRHADYDKPDTLRDAFREGEKVLFISASEVGKRLPQHQNLVDAMKAGGATLVAYTSILKADTSGISLAEEHLATEKMIRAASLPFVFLRNSWYIENYTENLGPALEHGALVGCADEGRIAGAPRADYAAAAVAVVTSDGQENKIYELGGDHPFTMRDIAAEITRASGKEVVYSDVPAEQHRKILIGAGLPSPVADMLVSADLGIARGDLDTDSHQLSQLIGRPTTPLAQAMQAALRSPR